MNNKKIQNINTNGIKIEIDGDNTMFQYEHLSICRMMFNKFLTSAFLLFPHDFSHHSIKKSNEPAKIVQENVTTHLALDALYSAGTKYRATNGHHKAIAEHVLFNLNSAKAVRNRLKLVKKLLFLAINKRKEHGQKIINITSLASGSARAIIEIISLFPNTKFNLNLLDRSQAALDISESILKKKHFPKVTYKLIKDNVRNFPLYTNGCKQDIIEMVGLMDYLDEEKGIKIIKKIFSELDKNGFLITANIRNNSEKKFTEKIIKWKMIYREPKDLVVLIKKSGLKPNYTKIIYEPLGIHGVIFAQKK